MTKIQIDYEVAKFRVGVLKTLIDNQEEMSEETFEKLISLFRRSLEAVCEN